MNYDVVKNLKPSDFKRLCGVTKETFAAMCEVVSEHKRQTARGRKSNLAIENQVLLTLSFWREYRTRVPFRQRLGFARIECFAARPKD